MQTLSLRPYFANLYIDQARRFSMRELESAQNSLLRTDTAIKSGEIKPVLAMTLLVHAIIRCPSVGVSDDWALAG
jgi:DNA polymerase III delta subunit